MEADVSKVVPQEAEPSAEEALIEQLTEIAAGMLAEKAETPAQPEDPKLTLIRSILEQESEIRKEVPDFEVEAMMRQSPAFRALVLIGEPVNRALEYAEPERAAKRIEEEVLSRIRKRNLRPAPIAAQNPAPEPSPEDRLTGEEIRRIDALLKRGEKVYL